jgi:uncharacterized SAM-dependent methyltransferase
MEKKKKKSRDFCSSIRELSLTELIKRGYSVEGKNKTWNVADSKLWYMAPEQSKAFLDMEKYDAKQRMFSNKEIDLMKKNFKAITREVSGKPLNVIDLGCGSGEKALFLIKNFKDKSRVRYCPIDISNFMVDKALKTFSKMKSLQVVKFKYNVLDFFDLDKVTFALRKGSFKTDLLLLLGGSLENSEVHELLHDIRAAMKDGDYLIIGNKLTHPSSKKMVKYYNKSRQLDNLLVKTIEQMGINKNEVVYSSRFRGSRVEMFYTLKKDKTLKCKNKNVEFKAGDKIIVAISYKYTKDSLLETLNLYFNDVELFISKDGIYALALCKK